MRFQSRYTNASYVVRSKITAPHTVTGAMIEVQTPLHADFRGGQRIFDSVAEQKRLKWSDEERLEVERHLLQHSDFGRPGVAAEGGLYLAPGESIPPEHADLGVQPPDVAIQQQARQAARESEPEERRCLFFATGADDVEQCEAFAVEGEDYCNEHLSQIQEIEQPAPKRTRAKAGQAA